MTEKIEKDRLPTINIKGKEYTMVKDRVLYFNETYPNGSIMTELLSTPEADRVVVRAVITPNHDSPSRKFIDHAQETVGQGEVNRTSALENASTSAVGRALAFMGIGVIETIASADEVRKAMNNQPSQPKAQWNKPVNSPAQVTKHTQDVVKTPSTELLKATSFPHGANELAPDARETAVAMENFKPLSETRNTEIQARLQDLVKSKVMDRRKLSLFLDKQHGGKKAFDVQADQWEATMTKIEDAVTAGDASVKTLLKGD